MREFKNKPLLYLITKGAATTENFREKRAETLDIIKQAVAAEISLIQIREKNLPARLVYELTSEAVKLTKNSKTKLLVNDRADVALAANADGVHLTASSLPPEIVRSLLGADLIIGVSAHSAAEVEAAKRGGANFAVFGPVFTTPSKIKYGAPQGIEKLREAVAAVEDFPVLALGGIDETNYAEVLRVADGFAAIRFLNDAKNFKNF